MTTIELSQKELVAIYAALSYVNFEIGQTGNCQVTEFVFNDEFSLSELIQKIYNETDDDSERIVDEIDELLIF